MSMRKVEVEVEGSQWGPADEPALVCSEAAFDQAFHYWRGASGRRYLHSVYTLIGCPALPRANYILVRRYDNGTRVALAFGQTKDDAVTLNLAHLRQRRRLVEDDACENMGVQEPRNKGDEENCEKRRNVPDDLRQIVEPGTRQIK